MNIQTAHNGLIMKGHCGQNTVSICLFSPEDQSFTALHSKDNIDLDWFYFDNGVPYAYSYYDEYPKYHFCL